MDVVTLLAAYAISSGAPPAFANEPHIARITLIAADPTDRWEPLIAEASERFGIPESWILAVMRAESAGRTTLDDRPITSSAGAMGLMQVMPETYEKMRQTLGLGADPYDPHDNIIAGTAFLRAMYYRFGYPGFFAAYNAGPERYEAWLGHGTPLPAETLGYLRAISPDVAESVLAMGTATGSGGSGSTRAASSQPPSEPEFRSGRSLFFVVGNAALAVPESTNQVAKTPSRRSIFELPSHESGPSAPSKGAGLFVPLSHRDE
jgi:hypothetical protein